MDNLLRLNGFKLTLIFIVVFLSGGLGYYVFSVVPNGELGQGEKWRTLQLLESKYRDSAPGGSLMILRPQPGFKYAALGIPASNSKSPYIWILLDEESTSNSIKRIPKTGRFILSCGSVQMVQQRVKVSAEMMIFLRAECTR